jgi:hypothetical protein
MLDIRTIQRIHLSWCSQWCLGMWEHWNVLGHPLQSQQWCLNMWECRVGVEHPIKFTWQCQTYKILMWSHGRSTSIMHWCLGVLVHWNGSEVSEHVRHQTNAEHPLNVVVVFGNTFLSLEWCGGSIKLKWWLGCVGRLEHWNGLNHPFKCEQLYLDMSEHWNGAENPFSMILDVWHVRAWGWCGASAWMVSGKVRTSGGCGEST